MQSILVFALIVAAVLLVFAVLGIYLDFRDWIRSKQTQHSRSQLGPSGLRAKLRGQFTYEGTWRLYLVLTGAGLLGIAYLALSSRYWDFPSDLFESRHWRLSSRSYGSGENWLVLIFLAGPFIFTKAVDWVMAGMRKDRQR